LTDLTWHTGTGLVRLRSVLVRHWYAVRSAGRGGPDNPGEQLIL
jgi:hypothetical protein